MTLIDLVKKALGFSVDVANTEVMGVAQDSRKVTAGTVFVARGGLVEDGHAFAEQAVQQGAIAVVGERNDTRFMGVPYLHVDNAKTAIAQLSAVFWGNPSASLSNFGVTGTDGKTTTSFLLHHLLTEAHKTALMSTASLRIQQEEITPEGHFTTPEAPEVQAYLAQFRDAQCSHAVIETSSHGFAQHRLDSIQYDVGIWTNLSPEHLDFHKTLKAYRDAKITLMQRSKLSILNKDDPHFEAFTQASTKIISYGLSEQADWQAKDIQITPTGQSFTLYLKQTNESHQVKLPMIGSYNIHNTLAALAAAHQANIPIPQLIKRLSSFKGIPGRMEIVQLEPFKVIVDFAHTPAALKKALDTLRPITTGKLIVVIGAAGERDPIKRPQLGKVSQTHADVGIFTEEDNRSENIVTILIDMANGAIHAGGNATKSYWTIPDRRKAIKLAVNLAQKDDTIILAGKGHERTLERGWQTVPWNEVKEAQNALDDLKALQ